MEMVLPPKDPDIAFEELLQGLPFDLIELAREFKAFARARKIKSPQQLLRAVLLYCGLDQSLREVAGTLTLLDEPVTDEAVRKRFLACGPWVKALLGKLLPAPVRHQLPEHLRFLVFDGSTVQGPGAKGIWYRLHVGLDLVNLELRHLEITDSKTGEKLGNYPLERGDVALVDRGYCHPVGVEQTLVRGAHVVMRYNAHNLPLYDAGGERADLMKLLESQPGVSQRCLALWLKPPAGEKTTYRVWIHACRLPEQKAEEARRRCRKNAKKGTTPKQQTLYLAGWLLVLSSLPPEVLDTETVLALYRLRWQVELVIKRWKSLLDLDELRAREGSPLASLWLHGKFLYAQLLERRARARLGPGWGDLDAQRPATWWRVWKLFKQELDPLIAGVAFWQPARWAECVRRLAERPRRRRLQQLPAPVNRVRFCLPERFEQTPAASLSPTA